MRRPLAYDCHVSGGATFGATVKPIAQHKARDAPKHIVEFAAVSTRVGPPKVRS